MRTCDLVQTTTDDGVRLHGAWFGATSQGHLGGWTIVCVHGVGGNFYGSHLFQAITTRLNEEGASVLWTNNRGHDGLVNSPVGAQGGLGAACEIVDDCRLDIRAWLKWVGQHVAVSRVILWGHSLGAIKALYSMAHEGCSTVKGIIASSPPILSGGRFRDGQRREEYLENQELAHQMLEEGRGWDLIKVRYPFPLWIAAKAYLDKYGGDERYNFLRFATQVQKPILFTYGQLELRRASESFEGVEDEIASLPGAKHWFTFASIPRANHFYSDGTDLLGETILDWLGPLSKTHVE